MMTNQETLGNILLEAKLVDSAGLARALEAQERDTGSLGRALANLGLAEEDAVSRAIANGLGLESPALEETQVARETAALLPADFCRRLAAPLQVEGKSLRLAMTDPLDFSTIQDVEFRTGLRVVVAVAGETPILVLPKRLYPSLQELEATEDLLALAHPEGEVEVAEAEFETTDIRRLARDVNLPPIVRLVLILTSESSVESEARGLAVGADDYLFKPLEPRRLAARVRALLTRARRVQPVSS